MSNKTKWSISILISLLIVGGIVGLRSMPLWAAQVSLGLYYLIIVAGLSVTLRSLIPFPKTQQKQ